MRETLHNARGLDETRLRRAFRWVIAFRDFPVNSWQTVGGDAMMRDAVTLFTKGRAEFYLDGVRRGDRVPGTLSTEHDIVGEDGTFELRYVQPTTRVCIFRSFNRGELPEVRKHVSRKLTMHPGQKFLVAVGSVRVNEREFNEEQSFKVTQELVAELSPGTILLEFV